MDSSTNLGTCARSLALSDEQLIKAGREFVAAERPYDEIQTWLCNNCHECCKWISIQTYLKDISSEMEFYKFYVQSRGLTMTKVKGRGIFLSVPHVCPHLIEGVGCDSYETRPQSCRRYDGRVDFLLKDICKWNLLPEIMREEEENEVQQGDATAEKADSENLQG